MDEIQDSIQAGMKYLNLPAEVVTVNTTEGRGVFRIVESAQVNAYQRYYSIYRGLYPALKSTFATIWNPARYCKTAKTCSSAPWNSTFRGVFLLLSQKKIVIHWSPVF